MSDEAPLIFVVEDEAKIASLLDDYLQREHFRTHCLDRGDTVLSAFDQLGPDLILLDLMLPGLDGLAVCRALRSKSTVPIIMLTARVDEIDRLLGLGLGADDYICKPFSPREVVARVKAVLRRASPPADHSDSDAAGDLEIDSAQFVARYQGQALDLTPVEFRLLSLLAQRPGRVYPRGQMIDQIYTDGRIVSDRTVDSHIKNLRHKILATTGRDDVIRSVYGVGYKYE